MTREQVRAARKIRIVRQLTWAGWGFSLAELRRLTTYDVDMERLNKIDEEELLK